MRSATLNGGPVKHQTVFITGGFSTLGRAISEAMARRNMELLLHTHTEVGDKHISFAEHLETLGAKQVSIFQADFRRPDAIEAMFQQIAEGDHKPDLLINNAGIFMRKPLEEVSATDLREIFSVNTIGPHVCMVEGRKLGVRHIINLLDIAWNKSWKNHSAYVASKAALAAMTRIAAVEFAPNVRVNAIAPGLISVPEEMQQHYKAVLDRIPMSRKGTPEEVAKVVEFLVDAPHYINGEVINIDGGLSLR